MIDINIVSTKLWYLNLIRYYISMNSNFPQYIETHTDLMILV